jgi:hypothetical protein
MVAVVEFGDLDDEDTDFDDDTNTLELEDDGEDEDIPLTYDNTLGSQDPPLLEYIAIAGADAPVDGLALVELPTLDDDDDGGARTQLAQARRQADLAAIDRQAQLERAEGLEHDNIELRRQIDELREQLAEADAMGSARSLRSEAAGAAEVALPAALAREQSLRWRVGELEDALTQAMSRPVDELEAELARLREELRRGATEPPAPGNGRPALAGDPEAEARAHEPRPGSAGTASSAALTGPASGSAAGPGAPILVAPVRLRLEALVRRIERGGIGTLELRRELVAIARRLQPPPH